MAAVNGGVHHLSGRIGFPIAYNAGFQVFDGGFIQWFALRKSDVADIFIDKIIAFP